MAKNNKKMIAGIGIVVLLGLVLYFSGIFTLSVADTQAIDLHLWSTYSSDGNTITFSTPGYSACCPSGVPVDRCYGNTFKLALDLSGKEITGVTVNAISSNKWFSNINSDGSSASEYYAAQSAIREPIYSGINQSYKTGGLQAFSDGIVFTLAATDGAGRDYRWCCAGQCENSQYSIQGTISLTNKLQPIVQTTGSVVGDNTTQSYPGYNQVQPGANQTIVSTQSAAQQKQESDNFLWIIMIPIAIIIILAAAIILRRKK